MHDQSTTAGAKNAAAASSSLDQRRQKSQFKSTPADPGDAHQLTHGDAISPSLARALVLVEGMPLPPLTTSLSAEPSEEPSDEDVPPSNPEEPWDDDAPPSNPEEPADVGASEAVAAESSTMCGDAPWRQPVSTCLSTYPPPGYGDWSDWNDAEILVLEQHLADTHFMGNKLSLIHI